MNLRASAAPSTLDRRAPLLLGLLVAIGAVLRLATLGAKDLWFDEAVLRWIAEGSGAEVLVRNAGQNSAPPLFALLTAAVAAQLGDGEVMLRLVPALAGVLSIPAVWLLAREFTTLRGALAAAALVTIARSQLQYAQQVREYSLAFLVATLILLLAVRWWRAPTTGRLVALAGVVSLGVLLQYGLALLAAALDLVALGAIVQRRRRGEPAPLRPWLAAHLPVLAAVALVYVTALHEQLGGGGFAADGYLRDGYFHGTVGSLAQLLVTNTHALLDFAFPLPMVVFALAATGALVAWRDPRARPAVPLLVVPIAVTVGAALLRLYPYLGDRQCIFLLPMLYVAMGIAFSHLLAVGGRVVAAPLALAVALTGAREAGAYLRAPSWEPMRPMVVRLDGLRAPGDGIYAYYGAVPSYRYYRARDELDGVVWGVPSPDFIRMIPKPVPDGQERRWLAQLDSAASAHEVLWLLFTHPLGAERERLLERVARTHAVELVEQPNERAWLYRAERRDGAVAPRTSTTAADARRSAQR